VLLASRFAHPDDNKLAGLALVLDIDQLARLLEALDTVNPCAPMADVPSIGSLLKWIPFGVRAEHFHQEPDLASFFPPLTDGKSPRGSGVYTRHDIIVCRILFLYPLIHGQVTQVM